MLYVIHDGGRGLDDIFCHFASTLLRINFQIKSFIILAVLRQRV